MSVQTANAVTAAPALAGSAISFSSVGKELGISAAAVKKVYHWSGTKMETDAWLDGRLQQERTEICTRYMADKLRSQGVELKRPERDGTLHRVGLVSGKSEAMPGWKHQVFLPAVARSERHSLLRDFEYWSQIKGHEHLYYFVATSGTRCDLSDLTARFKKLHEALAAVRDHKEFRPGGQLASVKLLLRTDEFTMKRQWGFTGGVSFHPHSNVVLWLPEVLGRDRFCLLRAIVNAAFDAHVGPIEPVRNLKEIVKYVCKYIKESTKPDEVGIEDLPPETLAELYKVRVGLKPVQCLGPFKHFRKHLSDNRLKTSQMPDREGKRYLTVIDKEAAKPAAPPQGHKRLDVVVCLTDPSPALSPMFEPCIIVKNYTGTLDAVLHGGAPIELSRLVKFATEAATFNAAKAAAAAAAKAAASGPCLSDVHTFTETPCDLPQVVVNSADDHNREWSERPPDPAPSLSNA